MSIVRLRRAGLLAACSLLAASGLGFAQTLETETSRLLPKGWWKTGAASEFQTSGEGTESALPFLFEYGLTDWIELTLEPVAQVLIRPKAGQDATGVGDVETTLTWRFHEEHPRTPALAAAFEVKFPTAHNTSIGTRKTDYAGFLIASKRFGNFDTHFNASYTVIGAPAGVSARNVWGCSLAGVFHASPRVELFAELLGVTSATNAADIPENANTLVSGGEVSTSVPTELAGKETSFTVGAGRDVGAGALLFASIGYDNQHATMVRLGVTWKFK